MVALDSGRFELAGRFKAIKRDSVHGIIPFADSKTTSGMHAPKSASPNVRQCGIQLYQNAENGPGKEGFQRCRAIMRRHRPRRSRTGQAPRLPAACARPAERPGFFRSRGPRTAVRRSPSGCARRRRSAGRALPAPAPASPSRPAPPRPSGGRPRPRSCRREVQPAPPRYRGRRDWTYEKRVRSRFLYLPHGRQGRHLPIQRQNIDSNSYVFVNNQAVHHARTA